MSLQSDIAGVLRHDPVGRIAFVVDNVTVSKANLESVAKAIDSGDVAVKPGDSGPLLAASYSSFTSRRWAEGEKKILGSITVGADSFKSTLGKAAVFHESVHAMIDVKGYKVTMHNDEVVAYIAEAMFLRAMKTGVNGDEFVKAIYNAAFSVVDGHRMLAKHRVTLTWADCDSLRSAIKAHPAYS